MIKAGSFSISTLRSQQFAGFYVFVSLALLGFSPLLHAADTPAGFGALMARSSGKCLEVLDGSNDNGVNLVQNNCTGSRSQRFSLVPLGEGYFNIIAEHSGKCLNVFGAQTGNVVPVIQWPCSNVQGGNDSWRVQPVGSGYQIVAGHSGRCLDIEGASSADRTRVIQFNCTGTDNQNFTIGALGNLDGGTWSRPVRFPLVPAAAGVMSTGEILAWSAFGRMGFGGDSGYTQTALYDPVASTVTERRMDETGHDMFCPGTSQLADGRIMVTGGSSSARVSIYEPLTSTWNRAPDMNTPRAYHSSVALADGSVMVVGGSWSGGVGDKGAEVYRDNAWTRLTGVSTLPLVGPDPAGLYRSDNHMWLYAWTGNRVFQAGPSRTMHMITSDGQGTVTSMGNRGDDDYAMNGSAVMFEPGRILTTGGAPAYDDAQATRNANVINLNGTSVTTQSVQSMKFPRAFHHSVVLPGGEVMVVGGHEITIPFDDAKAALTPELFDPATGAFTPLAPMLIPRTYHSFALLMLDGRVFVGGGGLCGDCQTNHPDGEIFTPPYLLDGSGSVVSSRPGITSAPRQSSYGRSVSVETNDVVSRFELIRMASSTHSVNTDQRRIPLSFVNDGNNRYTLRLPTDPGIAPPGEYMLFAIDGTGVPSVARVVRLTNSTSLDTDGDGIADSNDPDDDNDGVEDINDAFPLNAAESVDTDSDGIGNNADTDDDGDGFNDDDDAFPEDPLEWRDSDGDGIGDNADNDTCSPGINPDTDTGVFIWQDCDGLWSLMATGEAGSGTVLFTGSISSPDTISDVQLRSIESSDKVVNTDARMVQFDLRTSHPWDDQFDFSAADDSLLCVSLGTLPTGYTVYAGTDRTPVSGAFNPQTLASCTPPLSDCMAPNFDASDERSLLAWYDCAGVFHLLATGAAATAGYEGHIYSSNPLSRLDTRSIENSDTIDTLSPTNVYFDLRTGGPWVDEIILTSTPDTALCVVVDVQSPGTSLLAGSARTPVTSPFDPETLQSCTPPERGQCGNPRVDPATEEGLFVWKACNGTWNVTGTGARVGGGTRYTGTISASNGFTSVTPVSLESADTLSTSLNAPLSFSVSTSNPWNDSFQFTVADDSDICVTVTDMPTELGRFAGVDRVAVDESFNPVTFGSCN